jgi:hypothetical protein
VGKGQRAARGGLSVYATNLREQKRRLPTAFSLPRLSFSRFAGIKRCSHQRLLAAGGDDAGFILASRDNQGARFNFVAVSTILVISPPVRVFPFPVLDLRS